MEETAYQAALEYLKSLTKFGINLGLSRIQSLLQRLGNPEDSLKIIHIGGTNGKGSTAAMLHSILQEAGFKVGLFTSPHLHSYRERIRINGELISKIEVVRCLQEMRPVLDALVAEGVEHPTEFEVSTALALYYFAREKPDFVILEVGLGGAIDSTNVVKPLITVLTSIGMDHMDYLGNTLEEIARVKAGIIKEGVPVVTSVEKPAALRVIEEEASRKNAKIVKVGQDVRWLRREIGGNLLKDFDSKDVSGDFSAANIFDYHGLNQNYEDLELALLGKHQLGNACTALAVCEILKSDYHVELPEKVIREGLKKVRWPGRLELICREPKILLDGAHNVDGMKSLAQALQDYAGSLLKRERLFLCLGMLQDKERAKAVEIIAPLAAEIMVTKPDSPRAEKWEEVALLAQKYLPEDKVLKVEDPLEALERILARVGPKDMLLVAGSLYLIGQIRQYLLEKVIPRLITCTERSEGLS